MKSITILLASIVVSTSLCSHFVARGGSRDVLQSNLDDNSKFAVRLKNAFVGHRSQVFKVAFSPDGKLLATADSDQTKLWTTTGELLSTLNGTAPLFSPDGRVLLTISNKKANLWDVATGQLKLTLRGHESRISTASFSLDGSQLATACEAGTVKLWDPTTGRVLATLWPVEKLPRYRVISRVKRWANLVIVEFSPDLRFTVTNTLDVARLWETATGRLIEEFNYIVGVASFSPDSKWLGIIGSEKHFGLLNLETWKTQTPAGVETDFLNQLVFSPDGRSYVTGSGHEDYHATLIDLSTGRAKTKIPLNVKWGFDMISVFQKDSDLLSFHPGSKYLMGASHQGVRIWDTSGQLVCELPEGRDPAAFSLDGKLLMTVAKNKKTVLLWEVESTQ